MKGTDIAAIGMIIIGLVLIWIPEPATTATGLLLVVTGFGVSEAK